MQNILKNKIVPIFDNKWLYKILVSYPSLIIQVVLAAVFFHLEMAIESIAIFCTIIVIALWFSRDMMACLPSLMFVSMSVLNMYGHFIDDYIALWPIALFAILGLIARPFVFRQRYKKGKMLGAVIAVAISVTIGGLGSISAYDYFKPIALYYVVMLGIGVVVAYIYMTHYINVDSEHNAMVVLSRTMLAVGLLALLLIIPTVIKDIQVWNELVAYRWKNNLSTFILFSMPFAFYYACKIPKYGCIYMVFGTLQYAAIMIFQSRGAMLFGTLIYAACVVCSIVFNTKANRIAILSIALALLVIVITVLTIKYELIIKLFQVVDVNPDESRVMMYKLAVENFFKYPIFGTGLGYVGEYYNPAHGAMYWYHSTPFQIIGSLGVVGVAAYGYQFWVRLKVCAGKLTIFNLFAFLSFLAFELMSLVNPGDFCPFPYVVVLTLILTIIEKANESDLNNLMLRPYRQPPQYVQH